MCQLDNEIIEKNCENYLIDTFSNALINLFSSEFHLI